MVRRHSVPTQRVFRRALLEDPIPRRLDAHIQTKKQDDRKQARYSQNSKRAMLAFTTAVHQATLVGLHNFPMKQPGNCDGNATRTDERQLFRDLGGQTGIAYITSGGEIDAYRNIQETGAYAGQVHDVSLVL
ncbi:uncharacterized protein FFB14_13431 [Fusarium fujikuroi]|nr:uncharacterized protein FFB14_13431 [Fusarium fujikuroi]